MTPKDELRITRAIRQCKQVGDRPSVRNLARLLDMPAATVAVYVRLMAAKGKLQRDKQGRIE